MPDTRDIKDFIDYLVSFVEGIKITENYGVYELIHETRVYLTNILISGIKLLNQHKDETLHYKLLLLADFYARRPGYARYN